jgi:ribosomal protein S18 acetylase RimI-like enzyme
MGFAVIHYRAFRNADPPALVEVWNACFPGRGAVPLRGNTRTTLLEYLTLAKPYFDPAGLILARADAAVVGLVHAGFGADAAVRTLDPATGIVATLGVVPAYRNQGVGGELLRRAEAYLTERGARRLFAGPYRWDNPFTFGLYGGSQAPGFLDSDPLAGLFFLRRGYVAAEGGRVLQRRLDPPPNVADGRFPALRSRYEILGGPWRSATWWQECVIGPVEIQEYELRDRASGRVAGRALAWVMDTFGPRWGEHAVGVLGLEVVPELRRRGLARFLLSQLLRHFHEQFFGLVEVQVPAGAEPAEGLLAGLGFQAVDAGRRYRRAES